VARLAVETAMRHFGRLDVVVNVAGGLTTFGPLAGTDVLAFDREIAINLKTAFLVSQAAAPELARTHGVIVNFASVAFFHPQNQMAVYAAAKAAGPASPRASRWSFVSRGCGSTRSPQAWCALPITSRPSATHRSAGSK
jgi:NADP-dependent 3-hydroxy acid dehydrogenase YdfG